jgi:hypothetical protein
MFILGCSAPFAFSNESQNKSLSYTEKNCDNDSCTVRACFEDKPCIIADSDDLPSKSTDSSDYSHKFFDDSNSLEFKDLFDKFFDFN